jgi:tetratricopeptide (TPR) repeat protein
VTRLFLANMATRGFQRIQTLLILVSLGIGVVWSMQNVDRQRQAVPTGGELSYLPRGEYLKLAVVGYRNIVADFIWLKAVQNFAGRNQSRDAYLAAFHAVDVATDLNPDFVHAYKASGTILSVWANMPNESVAILKKGAQNNPTIWELPFFLGYDYFYELHDPLTAAKYFQEAAGLPRAPGWLGKLAARMTVEAGDPDSAMEFLQRLYQGTSDERIREGLIERMREVEAERRIRVLERAVKQYKDRYGIVPKHLNDLASKGFLATIPEDPLGGQYVIRQSDGAITSTVPFQRLRVYRE